MILKFLKYNSVVDLKAFFLGFTAFIFSASFFSVRLFFFGFFLIVIQTAHDCYKNRNFPVDRGGYLFLTVVFIFVSIFSIFQDLYLNYYIKITLLYVFSMLLVGLMVRSNDQSFFLKFIEVYLILHILFFFVQFFTNQFYGYYIDFDSMIREQSTQSLHETKSLDYLWLKSRGGGLFSEPSFYAMATLPFIAAYIFVLGRFSLLSIIAIMSVLLGLSLAAIVVIILFLIPFFIMRLVKAKVFVFITLSVVILSSTVLEVYDQRVIRKVDYDPIDSRSYVFDEFKFRGSFEKFFGVGFVWDENNIPSKIGLSGAEVRDSSFFAYLMFCSGWCGFLFFLFLISYYFRESVAIISFFFILMLLKYHVVTSLFWFLLVVLGLAFKFRRKIEYTTSR